MTIRKLGQLIEAQSLSRVFAVEHAAEVFVDGRGAARERFIGSTLAMGTAALAALSAPLILFVTKRAVESAITAVRTWRGYPVVILAAMVALRADRHTSDSVTQFYCFSIGSVS